MICYRCGRLLNRATGKCVCDDYDGDAPPPVAVTHPPPDAPPPISAAAAFAVLDVTDRPPRPEPGPPSEPGPASAPASASQPPPAAAPTPRAAPAPPPAQAPAPQPPGAPVGTLSRVRVGWRVVDVVVFEGGVVLVHRAGRSKRSGALSAGQLESLHPSNRVIDRSRVRDVLVREDRIGGRATVELGTGERVVMSWWALHNPDLQAEHLLAEAFPGHVDQAGREIGRRAAKAGAAAFVGLATFGGAIAGISTLLHQDATPAAAPAHRVVAKAAEPSVITDLVPVCATWDDFVSTTPPGERPAPATMRPVVDAMRGPFEAAAAAVLDYVPARDELVFLQAYARRSPEEVSRESVSRVGYALGTVTTACQDAASGD